MDRLLFTGGGGAGTEAIWRLLGDRYDIHFADADPAAIDPLVPADRRHAIPMALAPGFAEAVGGLCRRLQVDVLIPSVDEELPLLAASVEALAPTRLMLPHADYVAMMLDKLRMARLLAETGLPAPRSGTLADPGAVVPPCFSKPRSGRGSRGILVLESAAQMDGYRLMQGEAADRILVQDLLVGQEYTVMMAADASSRLQAVVPVKVGQKRGITVKARTDQDQRVIDACAAIHAAVPAAGCYNIQLIRTESGVCVPFEINPRISTTFCVGVAAGIDPIAVFLGRSTAPAQGFLPFRQVSLTRRWVNHLEVVDHGD